MRVPLSWLANHVEIDVPALTLADRLTDAGLEIEQVDQVGEDIAGVLTARVLAVEPHPGARVGTAASAAPPRWRPRRRRRPRSSRRRRRRR